MKKENIEFREEYNPSGFAGCVYVVVGFLAGCLSCGLIALIVILIKHGL
jgi:hypothetical protein